MRAEDFRAHLAACAAFIGAPAALGTIWWSRTAPPAPGCGGESSPARDVLVAQWLAAAAAAERGFGVLHYDHHFERLATVLGFTSQWIAPAGSMP